MDNGDQSVGHSCYIWSSVMHVVDGRANNLTELDFDSVAVNENVFCSRNLEMRSFAVDPFHRLCQGTF